MQNSLTKIIMDITLSAATTSIENEMAGQDTYAVVNKATKKKISSIFLYTLGDKL